MADQTASKAAQVAARLASAIRGAGTRVLTVDTTVRAIALGPGGWRLYGHATQVYYAIRTADGAGAIKAGETAPSAAELAAAAAGTATGSNAWDATQVVTALRAPTDPAAYAEIAVKGGAQVLLYVRVAAATAAPVLEGPFEDAP
jgi:hypothetical protein